MMTWQLGAQDTVLYLVLVAAAVLYSRAIEYRQRQREQERQAPTEFRRHSAHSIALTFRRYCILVLSGLMLAGVLYQLEVISRIIMAGLFALLAIACVIGLIRLRRNTD